MTGRQPIYALYVVFCSGMTWFASLCQDARFASRSLRRTPLFALLVMLTLAVGIASSTAAS